MSASSTLSPSCATTPRCPICSGETEQASAHVPYAYWRCHACGTAHLHPQPGPDDLATFYESFHEPDGEFAAFEDRMALDFPQKARRVAASVRAQAADTRQTGSPRVLDVGCGKGLFVRALRDVGLDAEGFDISHTAVETGTKDLGITGLRAGDLDKQTDWHGRFAAVTVWATIEHVAEPVQFLATIGHFLEPGGQLFLDTGLAGDLVDRWIPGMTQWYDPPQHLYVFSRGGIEHLLAEAEFTLKSFDPHFERSPGRRAAKYLRNRLVAVGGRCLFRAALGRDGYRRMRMECKVPVGSLMFVVARKAT